MLHDVTLTPGNVNSSDKTSVIYEVCSHSIQVGPGACDVRGGHAETQNGGSARGRGGDCGPNGFTGLGYPLVN